jgi:integrase
VSKAVDRHGRTRWRFRKGAFSTYLPGAYGSAEWRTAYAAAVEGTKAPKASNAPHGTVSWLVEQYLGSLTFKKHSEIRKRNLLRQLDWLRDVSGKYPFARMEVKHIEAVMAKKTGPAAQDTVRKNFCLLFNFAARKLGYAGPNPAKNAERMGGRTDGFHTWTDDEIARFLGRFGPGTRARLVLLLALDCGMSRQDIVRAGWPNVHGDRIVYRRGKTGGEASIRITPRLMAELATLPRDRLLFLTPIGAERPFSVAGIGNWFHDRCREAEVPGTLHGLRKAGATQRAEGGASENEIAAFLAHRGTQTAATYTRKASRARLADGGAERIKSRTNMSNLRQELDKQNGEGNV